MKGDRLAMAVTLASLVTTLAALQASPQAPAATLARQTARFAPTDLTADISALPANEREALTHLVRAAQVMDALFMEQVWAGNPATLQTLLRDDTPLGRARLHAFLVNKGPWSRLDHNEPFVPGAPAKPASANFYPAGATKAEVEKWIASLPAHQKADATGFFTHHPPRGRRPLHARALQHRVPGRARHRRPALARRRGRLDPAHAEGLPRIARRRVRLERLLRERRHVDGARRHDRADHRPLRGLRGRVVQLQGGLRGLHHREGPGRVGQAPEVRRPRCRRSRTTCRWTRSTRTRGSAPWRPSPW